MWDITVGYDCSCHLVQTSLITRRLGAVNFVSDEPLRDIASAARRPSSAAPAFAAPSGSSTWSCARASG
eukprot:8870134-Alexandrium_andersonii.AAC.1